MADNLLDMAVFVRIVAARSLSAAARELGLSLTVVSRRLARLEDRLGIRLLNRTTRTTALTEEGTAFHARCVRILADIEDAELEASQRRRTATGLLRLTATVAFSRRHLAGLLRDFQALNPGLRIHLDATDAVVNLVDGGFDLAIRIGALPDSSLIARQIAPSRRVIIAAPAYLDARGRPRTIEDLVEHDVVGLGDPPGNEWVFADGRSVRVRGSFTSNAGELTHQFALLGAGLAIKSIWDVEDDIAAGRLEIVLPDIPLPASTIHAVYPHSRHAAAKVRLCVAYLASRLNPSAGVPAASA